MKKMMLMLVLGIFIQMFAVSVDGYAYLEGQTDHNGIEVFFQRVVPDTLVNYTVYTDSLGYYTCTVESGWFDVKFNKLGFKTSIRNVSLYSDQTLDNQTLNKEGLSGSISGILNAGEYTVTSTLVVEESDSLIIEPGVTLNFATGTELIVNGYLKAEGSKTDSIIFKSDSTWPGVILNTSDNSSISYSLIKDIDTSRYAVKIFKSILTISKSDIHTAYNGIYTDSSEVNIENVNLLGTNNTTDSKCIEGKESIVILNNSIINCFCEAISFHNGNSNIIINNCLISNISDEAIAARGELYIYNSTLYAYTFGIGYNNKLEIYNSNIIGKNDFDSFIGIEGSDSLTILY